MNADTPLLQRIPVGPMAQLRIPDEFARLYDLAYNSWWSWDPVASRIWGQIDPRAWVQNRNPMSLLQVVEPSTWEALAANSNFTDLYAEAVARFDDYMPGDRSWYATGDNHRFTGPIAYLSAEFGVYHKLPFYSGGLGVLAGDHLKAASDLGLPLFGVGLLYRRGYFSQSVDPDGWQQHIYSELELSRRPLREILDPRTGRPLRIEVRIHGRTIAVGAWRLDVGRVPLLMLDTDLPENDPADRPITHILYVRGREMRFAQETVLGVGGARVIKSLGLEPAVWHINEGHAAIALLERLSWEMKAGADRATAQQRVVANTLFTLHTPVPAGNEIFDLGLASSYLKNTITGIGEAEMRELGANRGHEQFDLGALAIRLSHETNGVSKRHAEVVTEEWGDVIGGSALAVTNGVHAQTWVGRNIERLVSRAVGSNWIDLLTEPEAWKGLLDIDDEDLWRAHEAQKELMLRRLRSRLREEYGRHGQSPDRLRWIDDQLPPNRLTIVFARRFATYKRAGLIFSDPGRITHLLTNPDRPVQLVFAGKAHPADRDGQSLVKWIVEMSQSHALEGHVFFVEDYNMLLGRTLTSGADVWLNNPIPPKEASGTSGMKSALNGGLNLSVLDGWWLEAFNGNNGWGFGQHYENDAVDAGTLYHLLETEVIPRYYDRDERGVPVDWVRMMKEAMLTSFTGFTTQRMVKDYATKAYFPLAEANGK